MRTFLNDKSAYSLSDRKRAILESKEFIASVDCVVSSASRLTGSSAAFRTNLPFAVRGVYAASLKSLSLPMTFGNEDTSTGETEESDEESDEDYDPDEMEQEENLAEDESEK